MRIQLTLAADNSKMIVLASAIVCVMKIKASGKEGSPQFSAGALVLLHGGHSMKVREFVSVVDFLIAKATDGEPAAKYFAKDSEEADLDYAEFQKASGRNAPPVQTAEELAAQDDDQPELATAAGGQKVF